MIGHVFLCMLTVLLVLRLGARCGWRLLNSCRVDRDENGFALDEIRRETGKGCLCGTVLAVVCSSMVRNVRVVAVLWCCGSVVCSVA